MFIIKSHTHHSCPLRLFRDKEYASAALAYTRAIDLCPTDDESAEQMVCNNIHVEYVNPF